MAAVALVGALLAAGCADDGTQVRQPSDGPRTRVDEIRVAPVTSAVEVNGDALVRAGPVLTATRYETWGPGVISLDSGRTWHVPEGPGDGDGASPGAQVGRPLWSEGVLYWPGSAPGDDGSTVATIWVSRDQGRTFDARTAPLPPPRAGTDQRTRTSVHGMVAVDDRILALGSLAVLGQHDLPVGPVRALAWASVDRGRTWTLDEIDPAGAVGVGFGTHTVAVHDTVFVTTGGYEDRPVWSSPDAGRTWFELDVVARPPFGQESPLQTLGDRLLVSTPDGMLATDDDGRTWQPLGRPPDDSRGDPTRLLPGVVEVDDGALIARAVTVDAQDVTVLLRSTDGGRTWASVPEASRCERLRTSYVWLPVRLGTALVTPANCVEGEHAVRSLVLVSTDEGRSWSELAVDVPVDDHDWLSPAVAAPDGSVVFTGLFVADTTYGTSHAFRLTVGPDV